MKKKNGFISTTMIFSFFIVFLATLIYIISDLSTSRSLSNALKEEIKSDISDIKLARYIINNSEKLNNDSTLIIYHSSVNPDSANDFSYRYVGENPDNYVCFGTDVTPCPNNNLYRIIGVFEGKVKLIKYTSYGLYAIDAPITGVTGTNVWLDTSIYKHLNETYLATLGDYANLIANNYWYYDGINSNDSAKTAKEIFDLEFSKSNIRSQAKVGLLYISDYAYSLDSRYWNTPINEYNLVAQYSWLYDFLNTWTMTRVNDENNYYNNFYIDTTGNTLIGHVGQSYSIRPVFYLNSITLKTGGNGSFDAPYRVR